MKTQVLMKRPLFDGSIRQKSDNGYLSANDLMKAGNKWRIKNNKPPVDLQRWFQLEQTKEFVNELENQLNEKVKIASRGRKGETWLHPYLFIDLALYISPKLKIEVYQWLYDELLKYRNNSGDSYKKMTGALWHNSKNKSNFKESIRKTANIIKKECGVIDWQKASEEQLRLRDKIHENIALLSDVLNDNNEAIRLGIIKAKEQSV